MVKGFYFSMDAVVGLMLMSAAAGVVMTDMEVGGIVSQEVEFDTYSSYAVDISYLIKKEDFSTLNQSYRDDLVESTVLQPDDRNIGSALAKLYSKDSSRTSELARNYFETFRYDVGLYIEGEEVLEINADSQSSKKFHIATENGLKTFTVVVGE
jgi:hypothetical protein